MRFLVSFFSHCVLLVTLIEGGSAACVHSVSYGSYLNIASTRPIHLPFSMPLSISAFWTLSKSVNGNLQHCPWSSLFVPQTNDVQFKKDLIDTGDEHHAIPPLSSSADSWMRSLKKPRDQASGPGCSCLELVEERSGCSLVCDCDCDRLTIPISGASSRARWTPNSRKCIHMFIAPPSSPRFCLARSMVISCERLMALSVTRISSTVCAIRRMCRSFSFSK